MIPKGDAGSSLRGFIAVFVPLVSIIGAEASDYGTSGLIDTPTARFDEDGVLSVSASTDDRHRQFSITYQATPWLQGTFRYTGFDNFFYWDRNYELKIRLMQETALLPQTAIGIRDIVGTGVFGSEYLVASKNIAGLDFSLGLGWGRLSGGSGLRNPLIDLDERFANRSQDRGVGGELSIGDYFSGSNIGVFGGVEYQLERLPLTVVMEYNPDEYKWSQERGVSAPETPLSIGLTWHALSDVDVNVSFQHGSDIGIGFRAKLDSKFEAPRRPSDSFISSYYLSQSDLPVQINKASWYDRLLYDVERSGLLLVEGALSADGEQARLVIGNTSYALWADAIGVHTALADLHLPATVRSIYFVVEEGGHRSATLVVPRPSSSSWMHRKTQLAQVRVLSGRTLERPQNRTSFVTGKFNSTFNIRSRFQLFDPDDPARYQVFADISSEYTLSNHWAIRSSIAINLDQNFEESNRKISDSKIKKVRSDVVQYLDKGESGIEKLLIEGRDTFKRDLHYRIFAGYLETMYSGLGTEVLYWPERSRLAVGVSLAYLKQRDFDRGFNHLDYRVFTGHASVFWASPFYNYDVALHVGRYLAKDVGGTIELRRTFRNGWQIGAWATLTDVPFEDFGEGSFDKGLYFKIPLDNLFNSRGRGQFSTRMRPIQRDGGQRLDGFSGDLFWDLRGARYDAFRLDERILP